jgi:ubiquitin-like 1-activating enzyme E1 A
MIEEKMDSFVNEHEALLYDRQIRLWGFDTQRKMKDSKVCVVSKKVGGLMNEVAKNIVLAGVGSITLISHHVLIKKEDALHAFSIFSALHEKEIPIDEYINMPLVSLLSSELQKLNESVKIETMMDNEVLNKESFFSSFNVVLLLDLNIDDMVSSIIDLVIPAKYNFSL